jgi:hypothetical protein
VFDLQIEERVQGPLRALKTAAAKSAHVGLEGDGLVLIGGDLLGGEEPVEFVFGEGAIFGGTRQPAEKEMCASGKSHLGEGNAQREFEKRRGGVFR